MTAANFPAELVAELAYEGGFVNNPSDPGGATDFGITLATYSHWLGRQATIDELKGMSSATKAAIYHSMFWNVIQGDALPSGVDLIVFDMAVNGGPKRAVEMLQRAVGATPDGDVGPHTLAAVNAAVPQNIIKLMSVAREVFYRGLPTFSTFGNGWLNRVHSCEAKALALLGG